MPRILARILSVAVAASALPAVFSTAYAGADPAQCPDVQIVFARGSAELPGLGIVGTPFVKQLTAALPDRTVDAYAVDYAADITQRSAGAGATDIAREVADVAARCSGTEFVLGGYSQGASATAIALGVPTDFGVGETILLDLAPRIKAVVTFGDPLGLRNQTISGQSALYGDRARTYCTKGDPVCGAGLNVLAHIAYPVNSTIPRAVKFATERLLA